MNKQTEQAAVEKLLRQYANALIKADASFIPSFYTQDGQFMPEGHHVLSTGDLLNRGNGFFKKTGFQIYYSVQSIAVDGDYAFVNAKAKTVTTNLASKKEVLQTSQDFFVLRKEQEEWKIFRYIFNNVKEQ